MLFNTESDSYSTRTEGKLRGQKNANPGHKLREQKSANPVYGRLLRKVRRRRGISARQLAKEIGVDASYVSKIETLSAPPPAWDKMLAINSLLDFPDLLEAGEFALIRHTMLLNGNLRFVLDKMPHTLVNEFGTEKVARWRKECSELDTALLSAYDRRVRWVDVPVKNRQKRVGSGIPQIVIMEQTKRE